MKRNKEKQGTILHNFYIKWTNYKCYIPTIKPSKTYGLNIVS